MSAAVFPAIICRYMSTVTSSRAPNMRSRRCPQVISSEAVAREAIRSPTGTLPDAAPPRTVARRAPPPAAGRRDRGGVQGVAHVDGLGLPVDAPHGRPPPPEEIPV